MMKKNKYQSVLEIDETIDLHGLNIFEAEITIIDFLKDARQRKLKNLKIITGKGLQSIQEPVIKNLARKILTQKKLKFESANAQNGGTGAFVVKI